MICTAGCVMRLAGATMGCTERAGRRNMRSQSIYAPHWLQKCWSVHFLILNWLTSQITGSDGEVLFTLAEEQYRNRDQHLQR